jgi:hypothetical protein
MKSSEQCWPWDRNKSGFLNIGKGKGKAIPVTGHEGP